MCWMDVGKPARVVLRGGRLVARDNRPVLRELRRERIGVRAKVNEYPGRPGMLVGGRHVEPDAVVGEAQGMVPKRPEPAGICARGVRISRTLSRLMSPMETACCAPGLPAWIGEPMLSPSMWIMEIGGKCSVGLSGAGGTARSP
jgi:hypothetical protein